ncbi:prepilin-type N-terminal cleavage/methylation domain-containing protein [Leifsonia sp. NPDC058230]|uniref:type IV pilus modification PilV family protein n=1 Tax=Leifsonia sp. NPDC058230 TaxID=3346391 RepID=UPI0036DC6F87
MNSLRARLNQPADREAGFTIIEVMVAMMIFMIIAVGVAAALTSSLTLTKDSRSREVAANLAAQDIDVARSINDVMTIVPAQTDVVVDGLRYTITRSVAWVTTGGGDGACGTADGALQYKHVNVRVDWQGRSQVIPEVQADTLIAPNGRINDPSMGTILVSVTGVSGAGIPGITVSVTPAAVNPNGAQPVIPGPAATDVQGCSYALKVPPGNYDVKISTTAGNYVNEKQKTTETQTKPVVAGDSVEADFQFDKASNISAVFAGNVGTSGIWFPSNLVVNWASENSIYSTPVTVPVSKTVPYLLHPFTGGYDVFAGTYVAPSLTPGGAKAPDCISPDPGQWKTPNLAGVVGQRLDDQHVATQPGDPDTVNVRMGVVNVSNMSGKFLTAVSATADPLTGDPGCAVPMTYTFTTKVSTSNVNLALPFGSWILYSGSSSGAKTSVVPLTQIALPSGSPVNVVTPGVFTIDPRVIQ